MRTSLNPTKFRCRDILFNDVTVSSQAAAGDAPAADFNSKEKKNWRSFIFFFRRGRDRDKEPSNFFFSNSNGSNFFSQMESWKVDFWRQIEKKCRLIVVVTKQTKRNGCSRSRAISRKTKLSTASRFRHRHRFSLSEPVSNRFSKNCHRSWDAIFESAVTGQMWARLSAHDF